MSGMTADPEDGAAVMSHSAKLLKSPMNDDPVRENPRVYPQSIHWNVQTAMTAIDWNNIVRALFRRERPP